MKKIEKILYTLVIAFWVLDSILVLLTPEIENIYLRKSIQILCVLIMFCIGKRCFYYVRKIKYMNAEKQSRVYSVKTKLKENQENQTVQITLCENRLRYKKSIIERLVEAIPLIENIQYLDALILLLCEKREKICLKYRKKTIDLRKSEVLDDFNKYYGEIYCKNKLHKMKIIFFNESNKPFRYLTVDKNGSVNILINLNEKEEVEARINGWLSQVNARKDKNDTGWD